MPREEHPVLGRARLGLQGVASEELQVLGVRLGHEVEQVADEGDDPE